VRLTGMRILRVVSALLLVVAAGLGAAAAAGAFAATPATAGGHAATAHVARALPQDDPTSALMRHVLIGGEPGTIAPAVHRTPAVGSGAAGRSALAVMPAGHGSRVLGTALAYVTEQGLGRHRLTWLVSLDLADGLTNPGGPDSVALGLDNFIVAFVDAMTGRWEMTTAGNSASLPPLPFIRG
jgi:hypothetical protein